MISFNGMIGGSTIADSDIATSLPDPEFDTITGVTAFGGIGEVGIFAATVYPEAITMVLS